jgi:hypothetical protein
MLPADLFPLKKNSEYTQPGDVTGDVDHLLLDAAELDRLISQAELLCVLCSEPCGIVTGNDSGSAIEAVVSTA